MLAGAESDHYDEVKYERENKEEPYSQPAVAPAQRRVTVESADQRIAAALKNSREQYEKENAMRRPEIANRIRQRRQRESREREAGRREKQQAGVSTDWRRQIDRRRAIEAQRSAVPNEHQYMENQLQSASVQVYSRAQINRPPPELRMKFNFLANTDLDQALNERTQRAKATESTTNSTLVDLALSTFPIILGRGLSATQIPLAPYIVPFIFQHLQWARPNLTVSTSNGGSRPASSNEDRLYNPIGQATALEANRQWTRMMAELATSMGIQSGLAYAGIGAGAFAASGLVPFFLVGALTTHLTALASRQIVKVGLTATIGGTVPATALVAARELELRRKRLSPSRVFQGKQLAIAQVFGSASVQAKNYRALTQQYLMQRVATSEKDLYNWRKTQVAKHRTRAIAHGIAAFVVAGLTNTMVRRSLTLGDLPAVVTGQLGGGTEQDTLYIDMISSLFGTSSATGATVSTAALATSAAAFKTLVWAFVQDARRSWMATGAPARPDTVEMTRVMRELEGTHVTRGLTNAVADRLERNFAASPTSKSLGYSAVEFAGNVLWTATTNAVTHGILTTPPSDVFDMVSGVAAARADMFTRFGDAVRQRVPSTGDLIGYLYTNGTQADVEPTTVDHRPINATRVQTVQGMSTLAERWTPERRRVFEGEFYRDVIKPAEQQTVDYNLKVCSAALSADSVQQQVCLETANPRLGSASARFSAMAAAMNELLHDKGPPTVTTLPGPALAATGLSDPKNESLFVDTGRVKLVPSSGTTRTTAGVDFDQVLPHVTGKGKSSETAATSPVINPVASAALELGTAGATGPVSINRTPVDPASLQTTGLYGPVTPVVSGSTTTNAAPRVGGTAVTVIGTAQAPAPVVPVGGAQVVTGDRATTKPVASVGGALVVTGDRATTTATKPVTVIVSPDGSVSFDPATLPEGGFTQEMVDDFVKMYISNAQTGPGPSYDTALQRSPEQALVRHATDILDATTLQALPQSDAPVTLLHAYPELGDRCEDIQFAGEQLSIAQSQVATLDNSGQSTLPGGGPIEGTLDRAVAVANMQLAIDETLEHDKTDRPVSEGVMTRSLMQGTLVVKLEGAEKQQRGPKLEFGWPSMAQLFNAPYLYSTA